MAPMIVRHHPSSHIIRPSWLPGLMNRTGRFLGRLLFNCPLAGVTETVLPAVLALEYDVTA